MKRNLTIWLTTFALLCFGQAVKSQSNDPILLQVAGENITKSEFLKVYNKNISKNEVNDKKALEEYLDLYTNFRLKVAEAKALGMDTIKSFIDELDGYRKQLAQPYLVDNEATNKMILEAYDRKLFDVRASHILVKVDRLAPAADTLAAWNKIMKLRKRIIKGEDFGKVALEGSEDPSVKDRVIEDKKIKGNKGDLSYFSVFDMVYPFESAVYNLKLNEVSMPVRTDYGYHLIKLTDKATALGKIQLAHIILVYPEKATLDDSLKVADSANMAYKLLQKGTDFGEVAKKFSDDQTTASKGGVLPWFGTSRLLPQFVQAIQKLTNIGDYSEPFQTQFGWHILKLVDHKPVGSFDEEKEDIKQRIARNDRSNEISNSFIAKSKRKFGFTEDLTAVAEFNSVVNDSVFKGKWDVKRASGLNKTIFTLGTNTYNQSNFANYLQTTQHEGTVQDIPAYIQQQYDAFVNSSVMKYADEQLEKQYPEFNDLVTEYHDGILLFDLTDKKVWSKAVKDTVGLQHFYDANKNNYLWEPRLDASIYTIKDLSIMKSLNKLMKKKATEDQILAKFNHDSVKLITIDHKIFVKGDNKVIDSLEWKPGTITPITTNNNEKSFVVMHKILDPEPKPLNEIRGIITADYQNYLEAEWLKELRNKYQVKVNREVFNSILNN